MALTAKGTPYVVSTDLVANYPTVSSDLATHIDANLTYNAVTINAQSGTTYTFALADASESKLVTASNAAASTYTVPPQTSVTWANGAVLRILNQGAGAVTLTAGAGVTLNGATLVLAQYQYAEIFRTASNTWTVSGIAVTPGLVQITPTSTANTGGTVTTSGGAVTFTSVSAVSLNGVFTSTYENYFVQVTQSTGSTAGALNVRLRASGTDASGSNYSYGGQFATFTGGTSGIVSGNNVASFKGHDYNTTPATSVIYDVHSPQLAVFTQIHSTRVNQDGSSYVTGVHRLSTAYDGISFIPDAGTASGIIRVYGYRN